MGSSPTGPTLFVAWMKATVNETVNGSAVPTAKDDSESLLESTYLLRSPNNARRLVDAIDSARAGDVAERKLTSE